MGLPTCDGLGSRAGGLTKATYPACCGGIDIFHRNPAFGLPASLRVKVSCSVTLIDSAINTPNVRTAVRKENRILSETGQCAKRICHIDEKRARSGSHLPIHT